MPISGVREQLRDVLLGSRLRSRAKRDTGRSLKEVITRAVSVPGLVVILCEASGYTEVFGKIKAAPPADKRKDKV